MELDAASGRLIKILNQMAQASQDALCAGIAGDEPGTRQAVDRLRLLQAKLGTVDQAARTVLDKLPQNQQHPLREVLGHIQAAKEFIGSWTKRYQGIAKFDDLAKSVEGRHAILDYTLPLDWNFEGDVFLLFDEADLAFESELLERGQKRILFVGPEKLSDDEAGRIQSANSATALRTYFMQLTNPAPVRLSYLAPRNASDREAIWHDIKHAFTLAHSNAHTSKVLGSAWMTQGLQNLDAIAQSANLAALKPSLKGLPIVIISPGPSLDKNIHLLKEVKGRAILMAAAQCARALQAAGVAPDFLVVADPGDLVYFLDGVDTREIEALIIGVSSHPDFYKKPFKHIVTFNANSTVDAWISNIFGDTNAISTAGSVSLDCLFFAKYFECSHILMVGLDLALSEGKAYSTKSANSESTVHIDAATNTLTFSDVPETMERIFLAKGAKSEDTVETVLTLPGYYGGIVQTRPNYHLFHGEFVVIAKHEASLKNPTPLVNCTEGGAYIEGFEHIGLQEAIHKYIPNNVQDLSVKIDTACKSINYAHRHEQSSKAKEKILSNIEEIRHLISKCRYFTSQKKLSPNQLNQLNKAEKELIRSLSKTPFISLPNVEQVKKSVEMSNDASTISEANKVAEYIYDTIEMTSEDVLNVVRSNSKNKTVVFKNQLQTPS
jgi:hypothetical protein